MTLAVRFKNIVIAFGLTVVLVTASCSKTNTKVNYSTMSGVKNYLSDFTVRAYVIGDRAQETTYLGSLFITNGEVELPDEILTHLKTRSDSVASQVKYILKFYHASKTGKDTDFFYEIPVLSKKIDVTGATTAMWLAIKKGAQAQSTAVILSRNDWENMMFYLEKVCQSCTYRPAQQVFSLFQTNTTLRTQFNYLLSEAKSSVTLTSEALGNPGLVVVDSSPALTFDSVTPTLSVYENATSTFSASFYKVTESTSRIKADTWSYVFSPGVEYAATVSGTSASYFIPYENFGTRKVEARRKKSDGTSETVATFPLNVLHVNRPPSITVSDQNFQANHKKTFNVSINASDPDIALVGDVISYSLLSGPTGMTIDSSTGVITFWPKQTPDTPNQVGTQSVTVQARDIAGATATATFSVYVSTDNLPSLVTPITTWALSEGSTSTTVFTSTEADLDPLKLTCTSGCSLVSGSPAAAGWPSSYTYGGAYGSETISISYMPSYLETVGANKNKDIIFSLNYDTTKDPNVRALSSPPTYTVQLQFTNTDDPPVWTGAGTTQPVNRAGLTEGVAMNSTDSAAAVDPSPNPTAFTYSLYNMSPASGVPASGCTWISINATTGVRSGTPSFYSSRTCAFKIRATDTHSLSGDSNTITYTTVDVNRVPATSGAIPLQTVSEENVYTLDLATYFSDADTSGTADPYENLTYTCLNCDANDITGYTFETGSGGFNSKFTWTVPYTMTPTGTTRDINGIQFRVTDKGGATATQSANFHIIDGSTLMKLTFTSGSTTVASGQASINEGDTGNVILNVDNLPADASVYPYDITLTCSPTCNGALVPTAVMQSAVGGVQTFNIALAATMTDGDNGSSATYKTYSVTANLVATDGSGRTSQGNLQLRVMNVNRSSTYLGINGDSNLTTPYSTTIDGASFNPNTLTFTNDDPDGSNDRYTYSFDTTTNPSFGTIFGNLWSFNPIISGCPGGSSTTTKTFTIKVSDGRGGDVTRDITVTVQNATLGSGGFCPY